MFRSKARSILQQRLKLHNNSNKMLINFSHGEKKGQFRKFSSFNTIRNQVNNDHKDSNTCSDVNNFSAVLIIEKESTERFVDEDNTPILKEILESPPGKGPIIAVLPHSSIPFEIIRMIGVSKFVTEGLEQYREKDEQLFEKSKRVLVIFPISLILGVLLVVGTFLLTRTNLTEEEFVILMEKARNQLKQMVNPPTNEAKKGSDEKVWHYLWNDIKRYPAVYGLIALNLLAYRYTRNRAHQSADLSFFKTFYKTFTLTPHNFLSGRHYCAIYAAFMHSNAKHLFSNMAGLLIFGSQVCDDLGIGTFLALYFGAVITSSIGSLIGLFMVSLFQSSIGASGAVFALATAFLCLKDDKDSALYLKLLVGFLVAEFILVRFGFSNHDPFTHISGALFGYLSAFALKKIDHDVVRRVELDYRDSYVVCEMKNFKANGRTVRVDSLSTSYDGICENGVLVEGEAYKRKSILEPFHVQKQEISIKEEEEINKKE